MDINSFVTGFAMGKKNAKKPVLTELTVTENGVYDNPTVGGGLEPITWDGVVGDRPTNSQLLGVPHVKVSDVILSASDFIGASITRNDGRVEAIPENSIGTIGSAVIAGEGAILSIADVNVDFRGTTIVFPETGTYVFYADDSTWIQTITFPASEPTPADGWNKVTVNVAGDIIDVPELPTENVDDNKIYRITQTGEGDVYFAMLDGATPMILTVAEVYQMFAGRLFAFPIHEVDTLPDTMEKPDAATLTFPLYVLKSTGVAYVTNDGTSATAIPINVMFELGEYSGYAPSADAIVATEMPTWYTVRGGEVFTYGLPNTSDNKTFYEYTNGGWDECDSGERLMVDVYSLPTENIADNRVYRQVNVANEESVCLYVVTSDGRSGELKDIILEDLIAMGRLNATSKFYTNYYLVDELPETANDNIGYSNKLEIHIVRSTMEPYVYYNGKWMTFSERMRQSYGDTLTYGEFEGGIRYVGEAIDVGYYTLFVPAGTEYVYGVPNSDGNKTVYQYSDGWVNLSAMKATTDKLLLQRDGLTELVNEYEPHANFAKIAEFVVSNGEVGVVSNSPDADIETIAVPNGIDFIAADGFHSQKNLKKVILPESGCGIGSRAFKFCQKLEHINLPNDITNIGSETFADCVALREINIPVSVTSFSQNAFYSSSVSRFNYEGTKAQWKAITFGNYWCSNYYTVYCSDGTISSDGTET